MAEAFAPVAIEIVFEMEFSGVGGGWTDISADVVMDPSPTWARGSNSFSFETVGPDPQVCTFALRNDAGNSGGLLGYYSPSHANARSGFELGARIRIREPDPDAVGADITYGYYLTRIQPQLDRSRRLITYCVGSDWADLAMRQSIASLGSQVNVKDTDLFLSIQTATPSPAIEGTPPPISSDTFLYANIGVDDARQTVLEAHRQLARSGFGFALYTHFNVTSDTTWPESAGHWFGLTSRSELESNSIGLSASFNDDHESIELFYDADDVVTIVDVETPSYRLSSDDTEILYSLDSTAPTVPAGGSLTIFLDYRDPSAEGEVVTGLGMIDPVASTDYRMMSGGVDVTSDHTVTPTYFSSSVKLVVANTGSVNSVITRLRGRGQGLYSYGMVHTRKEVGTVPTPDERQRRFTLPWQSDPNVAEQAAAWLLTKIGEPDSPNVRGMRLTYVANHNIKFARNSYLFGVLDAMNVVDSTLGLTAANDTHWLVMKVTKTYVKKSVLRVSYLLRFQQLDLTFWRLGATASDDLGVDTKLGYF